MSYSTMTTESSVFGGRAFDREKIRSVLVCLDDTKNDKIGDCIVRMSHIKWLQWYFPHAVIHVNSPSKIFTILSKNIPSIEKTTHLPIEEIEYDDYEMVLLIVEARSLYYAGINEYVERKGDVDFAVYTLLEPEENGELKLAIPPLPELEGGLPDPLMKDISRREITVSEEEMLAGKRFLDQYVGKDEKLIIFLTNSSAFNKTLKMSVNIELIDYFASLPGRRLILLDPDNDREFIFRSLGAKLENTLFLKGKSLRETFAFMADERVELIFGPCTGLMHAASGIYNSLLARGLRTTLPHMLVYTGLYYEISHAMDWWQGSLVKCLILRRGKYAQKKIQLLEDMDRTEFLFQQNILPTSEYTASLIKNHLREHCQL
jgi:hypothetical protein